MKNYVRMNKDDNHLSYGNFSKVIKNSSKNKNSALQTEVFCILFNINNINDTTVNNYCIGIRSINSDYKQVYITYKKKFQNETNILLDTVLNLTYILDGSITSFINIKDKLNYINKNKIVLEVCNNLYNIAKNDKSVDRSFITKLNYELKNNNLYIFLCDILFYIILEKKQPLYDEDIRIDIIQNILNKTKISTNELNDYLQIKFTEGINFNHTLKKLANSNNSYAAYELGMNYFKGQIKNEQNISKALEYFTIAADSNHPSACYMIANIYYKKYKSNKEKLDIAYEYLNKAIEFGSIAATNLLGLLYLNGTYPLNKDIKKATKLFKEAAKYDYAYAYNNLGKLENKFEYFLKSANLNESWACNKVGLHFLDNNDLDKAFIYFNKAIDNENNNINYYAYYNLAINFYNDKIDIKIKYLELASSHNILIAMTELLITYINKYLITRDSNILNKINDIKFKIETHKNYDKKTCNIIATYLTNLKNKPSIKINI